MQSPSKHHLGATKKVLRCISGTLNFGSKYRHGNNFKLWLILMVIRLVVYIND